MGVQTINVISQLVPSKLDVHPQFFVTPDDPLQENGVKFSPSFMHTKTPPAPGSLIIGGMYMYQLLIVDHGVSRN